MTFQVRTARDDALDAVAALTERGFGAGPYGPTTDPERLRLLRDAAGRAAAGDLLVAADGDRLLGTLSLLRPGTGYTRQARDDEAEVRLLTTDPDARGLGVGARSSRESITRARAWGVQAIVLDTGPRNVASQRLYHRLGFERVVERETVVVARGVGRLAVFRYDLARHRPAGPARRAPRVRPRRAAVSSNALRRTSYDLPRPLPRALAGRRAHPSVARRARGLGWPVPRGPGRAGDRVRRHRRDGPRPRGEPHLPETSAATASCDFRLLAVEPGRASAGDRRCCLTETSSITLAPASGTCIRVVHELGRRAMAAARTRCTERLRVRPA